MTAIVAPVVPAGNTFDKYGSRNPLVRAMMARFELNLNELIDAAAPHSVLDVGCGEGVLTERWAGRLGARRVVGIDLANPKLETEWAGRERRNLQFRSYGGDALPFTDNEFDLVAATEVLEHVPDPQRTLGEMARVSRSHLLVSVPREPLWRVLNVARGAYLSQRGNTPGHLHHFSRAGFVRLLEPYGQVIRTRGPLPWTMLLVQV
jgi:2-polyprenyl-3-methyl-5-hydroxy-6-metoxy-1,4-benzoquinol methylase